MSKQSRFVTAQLGDLPGSLSGAAVAIGNFDGVHQGHQALIAATTERAEALGAPAVIMTFSPHPRSFFRPQEPIFQLTPPAARNRLLQALGIDGIVTATFDGAFAGLSPERFEEDILAAGLAARWVVVGEGFRFGSGRAGGVADLESAGARHGFGVTAVAPKLDTAGQRYASTAVRAALEQGDIREANRLLGYRWFVLGEVIHGEKRGRELGFPTANIRLGADCRLRHGIYAVTLTRSDGVALAGVASYGRRPQFDDGPPLLEVYVFDFAADLYGHAVTVTFHDWIRPELKFESVDALISAMTEDCRKARETLANEGLGTSLDQRLAGHSSAFG